MIGADFYGEFENGPYRGGKFIARTTTSHSEESLMIKVRGFPWSF
jgi:hypothetical protein